MGSVFLIRLGRLPPDVKGQLLQGEPLEFRETATRRWHIERGDALLFSDGHGDEIVFVGVGTVAEARTRTLPPEGEQQAAIEVSVRVERIELFPEARRLNQFMYSLQQVANLARPALHFRHHVRLSRDDVETLRLGRFSEIRSVYYGLLRHLPSLWRDYVQTAARLRALSNLNLGTLATPHEPTASQLLHGLVGLLDELTVTPAELAADIVDARRRSGVQHPVAWAIDENSGEWNMERFLSLAEVTRRNGTLDLWTRIRHTAATATDSELETQITWRPPHW